MRDVRFIGETAATAGAPIGSTAFATRSAANPHAHPAALAAALSYTAVGDSQGIVATSKRATPLVWPLSVRSLLPGLRYLSAPAVPLYDIASAPLVAPEHATDALSSVFAAVRKQREWPRVIVARSLPAEGPLAEALVALAAQGVIDCQPLLRWERAVLDRATAPSAEAYLTASLSGAQRKRLRNKQRQIEAIHGAMSLVVHDAPSAIAPAFAVFAALESSGWKGSQGTALADKPADAAYVLRVLEGMAQDQSAFIAHLVAGETPVAAGLFLRDGGEVFFWKTAYADTLARQSPGVIFDVKLTEYFYRQPWFTLLDTATDDSVDPAGLIWKQRRTMQSVVVDCRPGSPRGRAVLLALRARQRLKAWRNARRVAQPAQNSDKSAA